MTLPVAGRHGYGDTETGPPQGMDQLADLLRDVTRADGLRRVLRSVARLIGGQAAVFDEQGLLVDAYPELRPELVDALGHEVRGPHRGRLSSMTIERDGRTIVLLPLTERRPAAFLIAAGQPRTIAAATDLLADAGRLLWLRWQITEAEQAVRRLDRADSQIKEAVLHLLMREDTDTATRVAGALGHGLANPMRVLVAEHPPGLAARDELVTRCADVFGSAAWIVRCPVYARHVILLVPDDDSQPTASVGERLRAFARSHGGSHVGASQAVALRETAAGYEQAFHALATARNTGRPYALFNPGNELAALLGPAGRGWAEAILAPLLDFVPDRPHDPDARELTATLAAWLAFYNGATRQLKIHRNTLTARLSHIGSLLDRDIRDVAVQALLDLALRTVNRPRVVASTGDDGHALLDSGEVRSWAQHQLAPLLTDAAQPMLTTLRAWLANNASLEATATSIGISVAGTRKRLLRIESMLQRSLLHGPSARYDLWHALRVHDGERTLPQLRHRSQP